MKYLRIFIITTMIIGCSPKEDRLSQHTEYFNKSTSEFTGSGSLYRDVVADSLNAVTDSVDVSLKELQREKQKK
jgi:hypothetical protein